MSNCSNGGISNSNMGVKAEDILKLTRAGEKNLRVR
jgi:hypothetical protein